MTDEINVNIRFEPEWYDMWKKYFESLGVPTPPDPNGNGDTPETPYLIDMLDTPPPNAIIVKIKDSEAKSPLREVARFNESGNEVFGVFGKNVQTNRIVAKAGKELWVEKHATKNKPLEFKGDGGTVCHKLLNGQIVDGTYIYIDETGTKDDVDPLLFSSHHMSLYVLARHVS